jgi:hypothetical protein
MVSVGECQTLRLLHAWGWSYSQINSYQHRRKQTIANHVNGECSHKDEGRLTTTIVPGPDPQETTTRESRMGQVWTASRGFVDQG